MSMTECYQNVTFFKGQNHYPKKGISVESRKDDKMQKHTNHNVLGNYCWTCQKKTVAGLPGWPKPSRDDGPKGTDIMPSSVVWADGMEDVSRECLLCGNSTCKMPVHAEQYLYTNSKVRQEKEIESVES